MELSLALDAGAVPVVATDPRWPGSDPNDATSVAFASLLASLVASAAVPLPTPLETPAPDPTTVAADVIAEVVAPAASGVPAFAALPAAIALPAAPVPALAPVLESEAPVAEAPVELPAADLAPTLLSSPPARKLRVASDEAVEAVRAPTPKATAPTPVRPTAVQLPDVVMPVAQAFSSPSTPQGGGDGDQKREAGPIDATSSVNQPSAQVPSAPVREILKPEIVQAPVATASPVEQVVKAVVPLRRLADGTHNVVLELHPAELGTVRVELSLDAGIVHLGLRADAAGTTQLLRAALPELRSQLDAAGLVAGRVAVDSGQAGRRDGQPTWRTDADGSRRRPGAAEDADGVEDVIAPTYSTSAYGQIDVLL